jgi:hypothetical protein
MNPTPPAPGRAAELAPFLALAAVTLLAGFALRYPSLYEPRWYGDEGIFAAIAQNMREGRTLYSQAWDNKPPLIYFTYAGIQSLFGTGMFALHLATTLVVLSTQICVMAIALRLSGRKRALVAGLVFVALMDTPIIEGDLAMTETFMILPASLAVLAFIVAEGREEKRRFALYLSAGLLLGVAAGYKQVAIFDFAAIAAMIAITHQRPLRALAPLAAGLAAVQIVLAAFFVADGAFGGYWYAVAGSLGLYSDMAPPAGPLARLSSFLPSLMALAWFARRRQLGEPVTLAMFPALWLAFDVAAATSSTFPFPHYLQQAAPAAALTVAMNPLGIEKEHLSRALLGATAVLVAAVVTGQFAIAFRDRRQLDPVRYYRTFVEHRFGTMSDLDYEYAFDGKTVAVNDIVGYIDRDGAGTSVYTWSELPWIYPAGGYTNPTRYYTSFLGEFIPGAKPQILRDLNRDPPAYVVVSSSSYSPFEGLHSFLAQRYTLLHQQGDWSIYRLATAKGAMQPAAATPTPESAAGLTPPSH